MIRTEKILQIALGCFVFVLLYAAISYAGTDDTQFQEIYSTLTSWSTGYLGKVISIGAFLVGVAMGIVRQSITAVVTGLGTALAVSYSPTVIDTIVTALI